MSHRSGRSHATSAHHRHHHRSSFRRSSSYSHYADYENLSEEERARLEAQAEEARQMASTVSKVGIIIVAATALLMIIVTIFMFTMFFGTFSDFANGF